MSGPCINPLCKRPTIGVRFVDDGQGSGEVIRQAYCLTCGCAGPHVSYDDCFDLDLGDEPPTYDQVMIKTWSRARELFGDIARRQEPGKILGSLAAEARRAAR